MAGYSHKPASEAVSPAGLANDSPLFSRRTILMEAERLNQLVNLVDDLRRRLTELRGYL
jgi:hypothetical protein